MPGERTEQATQHRREKARKEGDVLHSRELSAAAGTLAGVAGLGMLGSSTLTAWNWARQPIGSPRRLSRLFMHCGGCLFRFLRRWGS
jgi:flagellar biosynthesis protein FlhB